MSVAEEYINECSKSTKYIYEMRRVIAYYGNDKHMNHIKRIKIRRIKNWRRR